jgi:hypothetical protein
MFLPFINSSNRPSSLSSYPRASLLGLPKSIRARILREAGLLRNYPISIYPSSNSVQQTHTRLSDHSYGMYATRHPPYQPFPSQLFLICSKLHSEALELFYGENTFHINFGDYGLIMNLWKFPSHIWASIRTLVVRCGLSPGPSKFINSIMAIKSLCQVLSVELKPYRTTISFFFDAPTFTYARLLLAQASNLPPLANVQLQIKGSLDGVSPGWEVKHLDQRREDIRTVLSEFARKLTNKPSAQFPFLRLPLELQTMVLSCTEIVVPSRKRGGTPISSKLSSIGSCCGSCRDNRDGQYFFESFCWCNRDLFYSSSCTCYEHLDNGLFATSKAIRQQALKIAFSENDFLIPHLLSRSLEDTTQKFLLIPSIRLQWIRRLTIEFEEVHPRQNSGEIVRFLLVVHRSCECRKLYLRLRFMHYYLSYQTSELKMLYTTISELAFGKVAIQLQKPTYLRLSDSPKERGFVTVLGEGMEQEIDEVVDQLMKEPRHYY